MSTTNGTPAEFEVVLDISGMPRLDAYRHLAHLFMLGLLRW